MVKNHIMGFGFNSIETQHHFLVDVSKNKKSPVIIYERYIWDQNDEQTSDVEDNNVKVMISQEKWKMVKDIVQVEFNKNLRKKNQKVGRFKIGYNFLERLLGKELIILLWAIEDIEIDLVEGAVKNWLGLAPEERWWLFTMTNASSGYYMDKRGWRIALRYILADNFVGEEKNKNC